MHADMEIGFWRVGHHTVSGFSQFWRDWQPSEESCLPVLALHGSLTQSGMWIALAETASTVRMLCPDQRGFGRSEDPGGDSCAEFASDALALAQDLLPERYVVMAHSFACSIAIDVAHKAARQIAAVVLVDPVLHVGVPTARAGSGPPPPESFATLTDAERHFWDTEEGDWTGDALRRFVQDIMMRNGESNPWRFPYTPERLQRLRAFTSSSASDYNLFAKANALRCPVLVFRGGVSTRFPEAVEQSFCEAFPSRPKLVVCPKSGHFPIAIEPEIVVRELKHFLDNVR